MCKKYAGNGQALNNNLCFFGRKPNIVDTSLAFSMEEREGLVERSLRLRLVPQAVQQIRRLDVDG